MPFTLNGAPVTAFSLDLPRYGFWIAEVRLTTDPVFAIGARASFIVEDLTFLGAFIEGDTLTSRGAYRIIGGAGAWRLAVPPHALRSDGGIKISTVANALVAAANQAAVTAGLEGRESVEVLTDRSLGPAHVRFKGVASATLNSFGNWFMRPSGVTAIGDRPVLGASTAKIIVQDFNPSRSRLTVALPQADVSALVNSMGGTLQGAPLERAVNFRSLNISLEDGKLRYVVNL